MKMREILTSIIETGRKYKRIVVPTGEALIFSLILIFSYLLRLGIIEKEYITQILFLIAIIVPAKIVIFWLFRLYHISYRFTSLNEIIEILKASGISTLIFSMITLILRDIKPIMGFPRSVIFIDFILTFVMSSGLRLSFRLFYFPHLKKGKEKKVLIVGAGAAGEQLVREMQVSPLSCYFPVAFVDDDRSKKGSIIHGVTIMGDRTNIPDIVDSFRVEEIIIAIPSASSSEIRGIMEYVRKSGVKNVKILPGLSHFLSGKVSLRDIREIAVEDLLGREPVKIALDEVASYLKDMRVMVSGAGGSIGSELCRQIATFEPSLLIMVDIGETELFYIDREIREKFPQINLAPIIADVKDIVAIRHILSHYKPQVVFHAAAYKHVPLMEINPREAVLNNIEGTKVMAIASLENNVKNFIFISTDKAVNPVGIMGATKRVAENLLRCLDNEANETTKFISVRFGNVLESRGSVVPLFKEQIKNARPVTITHPKMERYLMSISEAVQLVLQAGALGRGGEVFMIDMGKPVRILDLAKEMIRLSGLEPDKDIPIVFTGIRPGEKLYEELSTGEEGIVPSGHEKIFIAKNSNIPDKKYLEKVENLIDVARNNANKENIIALLKDLVPTYRPESVIK